MSSPSASASNHTTTSTTGKGASPGKSIAGSTATAHSYSTMMMGGNAVTTAVTLDDFELVRSKKSGSTPSPTRTSKNNRSTPSSSRPNSSESFFQGTGSMVPNDTNTTAGQTLSSSSPDPTQPVQPSIKTACVTTDFSMQNVMMQMGLSVISVDGLLIRAAKQWVLRCMACFKGSSMIMLFMVLCCYVMSHYPSHPLTLILTHPNMLCLFTVHYELERLFCSKCGAAHMSRVSSTHLTTNTPALSPNINLPSLS